MFHLLSHVIPCLLMINWWASLLFIGWLYVLEMALKVYAYGFENYWRNGQNRFDFIITLVIGGYILLSWHACRLTLILRSTMFQCLLKEVLNHYSCIATNFSNKRDTNKMLIVIIRTDECWLCLWNGNRTEAGYVGVVTCKWISTVPKDSMILFLVGRLKMNPIM